MIVTYKVANPPAAVLIEVIALNRLEKLRGDVNMVVDATKTREGKKNVAPLVCTIKKVRNDA